MSRKASGQRGRRGLVFQQQWVRCSEFAVDHDEIGAHEHHEERSGGRVHGGFLACLHCDTNNNELRFLLFVDELVRTNTTRNALVGEFMVAFLLVLFNLIALVHTVILKNTALAENHWTIGAAIDIAGLEGLEGARKSSTSHLRGPTDRSRPLTRESNENSGFLNVPAQNKQFLKVSRFRS